MSSTHSHSLILCESSDRWSVAWRRALGKQELKIVETRSLIQMEEALREHPQSLVGIEIQVFAADAIARMLATVVQLQRRFPATPCLAMADRKLATIDLLLRDAGFIEILYSRREVPTAVRLLRRHLQLKQPPEKLLGKE